MVADSGTTLLHSAAGKAARHYLEQLIRQADEAAERLHDPDDSEALHDFRVAIRRSRSWLKAFNDHIGIDAKAMNRLRSLARRTNAARDAEISLMWVQRLGEGVGEGIDVAAKIAQIELRRDAAYMEIRALIEDRWPKLSPVLVAEAESDHLGGPVFAGIVLGQATTAHSNLAASLEHVHSIADMEEAHRARIAAKRLRYLLEPFRDAAKTINGAVKLLKQVQDDLGDLHDLHVLIESLPSGGDTQELAMRVEAEKKKLFGMIQQRYLKSAEIDFLGQLGDAIASLHVD